MSAPVYDWKAQVTVSTNHPALRPLAELIDEAPSDSLEHAQLVAQLFVTHAIVVAHSEGYFRGKRDGEDQGAAPFLDGPWWKRAWTAARS